MLFQLFHEKQQKKQGYTAYTGSQSTDIVAASYKDGIQGRQKNPAPLFFCRCGKGGNKGCLHQKEKGKRHNIVHGAIVPEKSIGFIYHALDNGNKDDQGEDDPLLPGSLQILYKDDMQQIKDGYGQNTCHDKGGNAISLFRPYCRLQSHEKNRSKSTLPGLITAGGDGNCLLQHLPDGTALQPYLSGGGSIRIIIGARIIINTKKQNREYCEGKDHDQYDSNMFRFNIYFIHNFNDNLSLSIELSNC